MLMPQLEMCIVAYVQVNMLSLFKSSDSQAC